MRKEDVIIEAYDLIKGEIMDEYGGREYLKGVVEMSEAVLGMLEDEVKHFSQVLEALDVDCGD